MNDANTTEQLERPKDIHGEPVTLGVWYWYRYGGNSISGAGKFLSIIGQHRILFFVGQAGFTPTAFMEFVRADLPEGWR